MIIGATSKSAMLDRIPLLWNFNIILESLPISSSGHLKLLTEIVSFNNKRLRLDNSTEHLMHIPNGLLIAIFLVLHGATYLNNLSSMVSFCLALMFTNALTGVVYLRYKKTFERVPLTLGFLCTSIILISLFYVPISHTTTIRLSHAFFIGLAQTVSLIPGVSRMALTTATGIWLGIDPKLSFIYSLACEVALILIAVVVALKRNTSQSASLLSNITPLQGIFLAVSSLVSYGALWLSYKGFNNQSVAFVGFYLLGVSIVCSFYRRKHS